MKKIIDDFINNLPLDKQKIIVVLVGIVALAYVDFTMVITQQFKLLNTVNIKIKNFKKDVKNLQEEIKRIKQLQSRPLDDDEKRLGKKIYSEAELLVFLSNISDLANKNNVKITQLKPKKDAKMQAGAKVGGKASSDQAKGSGLVTETISLDLMCGYHSLGAFINHLENSRDFIAINSIRVYRQGNELNQENVSLELSTLMRK